GGAGRGPRPGAEIEAAREDSPDDDVSREVDRDRLDGLIEAVAVGATPRRRTREVEARDERVLAARTGQRRVERRPPPERAAARPVASDRQADRRRLLILRVAEELGLLEGALAVERRHERVGAAGARQRARAEIDRSLHRADDPDVAVVVVRRDVA